MKFPRFLKRAPKHILLGGLLALCCVACGTRPEPSVEDPTTEATQASDPGQTQPPVEIQPILLPERDRDPVMAPEQLREVVVGNSAFTWDFYQELRREPGNLFISPHSISTALAMTYAGARGNTEQQMADTLHFSLPQDQLHPAFNALDLELASRGESVPEDQGQGFQLNIANALWAQQDYEFLAEFLDRVGKNYGAGLQRLDFVSSPEPSRVEINRWVADQTEDRIKDLIPAGVIDSLTRLVLTNAIYFNAGWLYPFEESATQEADFHLLDGGTVQVPMMFQTENFRYAQLANLQAVELPYVGDEVSMLILLPDEGSFENVESALEPSFLSEVQAALNPVFLDLTLPKFEYETTLNELARTLGEMGMPDAIDAGLADFSGMTGQRDLFIAAVVHKAFVSVDEAGTEAAAATAVAMSLAAVEIPDAEMKIDRPFVFLIQDNASGAILFLGRVLDPSS